MINKVNIFDSKSNIVDRQIINVNSEIGLISKGGYKHFMKKEMFEQPSVIPQTIASFLDDDKSINIDLDKLGFKNKGSFINLCSWH